MEKKMNQAPFMQPLMFDPVNKTAKFEQRDNDKLYISYVDDEPGIRLEENGDVLFAMRAPSAKTVEVCGFGGTLGNEKISLTREEDGVFRGRVSGIRPGFLYHRWYVDGVQVMNPKAPFTYGCFGVTNFFEMPRPGQDFWYLKDVPHGDVQIHTYVSKANGHLKQCYIYTPPGYSEGKDMDYPVLYIQHGVGESETGWIWNGKLNFILDNLLAEGKCAEMIIVMCCGYAFKKGEDPVFFPGDFGRELVEDCIPYVESRFAVRKGRENRAMAGLSLGSAQATQIVSRFPELFAHLGVFSGLRDEETEKILQLHEKYPMRTVLMTAGTGEKGLASAQRVYADRFVELGAAGGQRCYEGHHEWHVWRESLRDFASLIFQPAKAPDQGVADSAALASRESAFSYLEPALSREQLDAQTFAGHICMFDPVYKGLILAVDEKGRPAGRYRDEHPGAEILDVEKGCVRFWFRGGGARSVEIDVWGVKKFPMTREKDGDWWSVTAEGIEKGFHYYGCVVNGVDVTDPNAPVGYGGFRAVNYLEMPEADFEEYRIRQVPHGTVHLNYYRSEQTGRFKLCYVYTPASYERETRRRYPVLYLQHGGGEAETGWIWQGKLANIADNLIAGGRMQETIIVMNAGYGFPENGSCHHSMSAFLEELPDSCVPFIDRTYRTLADREHRAMAGLSMGGMQTQKIVFDNPELFAWAGIFSGGLVIRDDEEDYSRILLNPEAFRERFRLLFVACGTRDGFYRSTKENTETVLKAGVPIEVYEDYGYHDWTFWRHCLKEFLRKIFQ